MLKSKICLVDVNVWLALAAQRHEHHGSAREWFGALGAEEAVFCRVTQMSFLRLLTNLAVMKEDVLKPRQAWTLYKDLRRDHRVTFSPEPSGLEEDWILLMTEPAGSQVWTDAYLAAFALGHNYALASFDRGFPRWKNLDCRLLA